MLRYATVTLQKSELRGFFPGVDPALQPSAEYQACVWPGGSVCALLTVTLTVFSRVGNGTGGFIPCHGNFLRKNRLAYKLPFSFYPWSIKSALTCSVWYVRLKGQRCSQAGDTGHSEHSIKTSFSTKQPTRLSSEPQTQGFSHRVVAQYNSE